MQTSEILNFAEFWNFNSDHAEEKDDEGTEVFIVGIISQSGVAQSTNSAGPLWSSCHSCRELKFSGRMSCGSWKISQWASLDTDWIIMAVFILWNKGHFVIISERPAAPLEKTGVAECEVSAECARLWLWQMWFKWNMTSKKVFLWWTLYSAEENELGGETMAKETGGQGNFM